MIIYPISIILQSIEPITQDPITDITVIFPGLGENVPDYFQLLDSSPSGLPADLNHGSFRAPEVFLCYRRGRDRPPLSELGIISPGADPKERIRWLVNPLGAA